MLLVIWEYLVNFIELSLFVYYIHRRLQAKKQMARYYEKQSLFLLFRFILICILNRISAPSMLTVGLSCFFDVAFALFFFENTILTKIFWGGMYSVICMVSDYIPFLVLKAFLNENFSELYAYGSLRIPGALLYLSIIAIFVFLFGLLSDKDFIFTPLQKITYFIISIIGILIGHFILCVTLESEQLFTNASFTFQLVSINIVFIVLFLTLLVYIYQLGVTNAKNRKLLEEQQLHALEEMEYKNLLKTTASLREMKHDIDIHLDTIQSLATSNKKDELLSYIASYHNSLNQVHHFISSGNTAIDCIVSSKIALAKEANINTAFSIMLPEHFPLDALSLSSLLGNLWNNAIEANVRLIQQHADCHPFINFYIKPYEGMVTIHIDNSYDGVLNISPEQTYLSVKTGSGHGIGLKRINDIVKKADGIIQIQTDNSVFSVHILLPLKELSDENNSYDT